VTEKKVLMILWVLYGKNKSAGGGFLAVERCGNPCFPDTIAGLDARDMKGVA
jgi:hypothetical protein